MDYEISERFAKIWRVSRAHAGVSQDAIAKKLGVSKKTVQNWEAGLSCPSQAMGFKWFSELGIQPLPYYLSLCILASETCRLSRLTVMWTSIC